MNWTFSIMTWWFKKSCLILKNQSLNLFFIYLGILSIIDIISVYSLKQFICTIQFYFSIWLCLRKIWCIFIIWICQKYNCSECKSNNWKNNKCCLSFHTSPYLFIINISSRNFLLIHFIINNISFIFSL